MKTVINKTGAPLKLPLPRGKSLHLGPRKTGQIRNEAVEHPALKKLVEAGKIEILEGEAQHRNVAGDTSAPHEATHGRGPSSFRQKTGDR